MNLMDQRESEREREGGEQEFYLFYFFSEYKLIRSHVY